MKKIGRIILVLGVFAALASCSGHEKCPTYNGKIDIEQPEKV